MMKKCVFALLLCVGLASALNAQLRYGFKTGLNFASMRGPSEMSAAGADLEKWDNVTGFHIGMTLGYPITDNFGVRGELLYSKKGAKYSFEGPGYRFFRSGSTVKYTTGNAKYFININNSYMDIPVLAYGRWKNFEVSGGLYASILIQSVGEGAFTYSDAVSAELGNPISVDGKNEPLRQNFAHNYRKDGPGEGATTGGTVTVRVDDRNFDLPKTLGAYYDYPEDKGNLYNTLDYGLVGGISYYLSRALYANVRLQYGLSDLTNNDADLAKGSTGENQALIFRDDKDRNFSVQVSVGFSF
jgi:hypothetical protein